jgi:hypothetical protein
MKSTIIAIIILASILKVSAQHFPSQTDTLKSNEEESYFMKSYSSQIGILTTYHYQEIKTIKSQLQFSKALGIISISSFVTPFATIGILTLPGQRVMLREPARLKLGDLITDISKKNPNINRNSTNYPTLEKLSLAHYYLERAHKRSRNGNLITLGLSIPFVLTLASEISGKNSNPSTSALPAILLSGIVGTYFTVAIKNVYLTHKAIKLLKAIPPKAN